MADRDKVKTTKAKLSPQIFPRGQPKCHWDTDLGQFDNPTHHTCHSAKSREKMGILQYDIRDTVSFNDLYWPVQVPEKSKGKVGGHYNKKHRLVKLFCPITGFCLTLSYQIQWKTGGKCVFS